MMLARRRAIISGVIAGFACSIALAAMQRGSKSRMYERHFLPLAPPIPTDNISDIKPLQSIPFECNDGVVLTIWLLGRTHTIDAIAISIPPEGVGVDRSKALHQGFEHMLATLRLCYDSATDVIRHGDGFLNLMNQTGSATPVYAFPIASTINENHVVDVGNVARVFCQTWTKDTALLISLLGEGQFPQIPPHYRFLSLYRALEVMFGEDKKALASRLNREAHQFAGLVRAGQKADGAMAELRSRCAHGKSRGSFVPLSGLLYEEKGIHQIVAIMRRIVADEITQRHGLTMVTA